MAQTTLGSARRRMAGSRLAHFTKIERQMGEPGARNPRLKIVDRTRKTGPSLGRANAFLKIDRGFRA